ncbi:MAG: NAD(P)/FAD-dependent oxidoreductase [Ruminococcus sp.]|nr:NAD(P)/FAD-dependent oxidoreductase [Ruminococcus sp.]
MPIIVNQIKTNLNAQVDDIISMAVKKSKINRSDIDTAEIYKTSLDARKQDNIQFVHSVFISLKDSSKEKLVCSDCKDLNYVENSNVVPVISDVKKDGRVVIAGFGPAGMFCGLLLAENGYRPIILEKGSDVDKRTVDVDRFWKTGHLDINSNVQFGEGGAGTFSDGKLTTRIKDPACRYISERFVEFGAPHEILTKAKAHIGTDNLRLIVKKIRQRIIALGGEVRFDNELVDFTYNNGQISSVKTINDVIPCSALVLAIGHSSRATFEMLSNKGVFLEAKAFSVGARIEHSQLAVDQSLYGKNTGNPLLPKGEYQLSHRDSNGRAVYTFCMCPGGVVVPAASEDGATVTNGMSYFARDGLNANAAMVVSVTPKDFGHAPLDGMNFARQIERNAFACVGSYSAPATTVRGFINDKPDLSSDIIPSYALGIKPVNFKNIFPEFVTNMMKTGLSVFSRKMRCFADENAILTAPETRTSSPVRITRTDELHSLSIQNLYPCGEGAGYAGGIMSAAADGIRIALKVMSTQAPD